jgi:hypothetical protein
VERRARRFCVDHIAIGPGGVVVLETKWTSDGLTNTKGQLNQYGEKAVRQVADNVPRINALLGQNRCDARVARASVASWGTRSHGTPLTSPNGVTVIDGDQLGTFLSGLDPVMSATEVDAAAKALNRYLGLRLEHIAQQSDNKKAGV